MKTEPAAGLNAVKQTPPAPLWVAVGALAIITLLTMVSATYRNLAVALGSAVLNVALLVGLVRAHKWAYVLTLLLSVTGIAVSFYKSPAQGLAVLLGDAFVLVPVLLSTSYFFPEKYPANSSHDPNTTNHQQQGNSV